LMRRHTGWPAAPKEKKRNWCELFDEGLIR